MEATEGIGLQELLKPFHHRAIQAEERLTRLEVVLGNNKNAQNEVLLKRINELESKLEIVKAELVSEREKSVSEREKVKELTGENAKLNYRIIHLVNAVKEADAMLDSLTGSSGANGEITLRLQGL